MSDAAEGRARIGTSGWSYEHWRGAFYPEGLPAARRLAHYAERFSTVEINNSFYRLPQPSTLKEWHDTVPADFVFAVKASRYITHQKKLNDCGDSVTDFLERLEPLGERLGPILFQLPPRWRFNEQRLAGFLALLSGDFHYSFEFRDHSWINQRTRDLLAEHEMAFCIYDLGGYLSPKWITCDFAYIRLHGPGAPYEGEYDGRTLGGWAGALAAWQRQGRNVYCYFDNDQAGYAARNALALKKMRHA